MVEPDCDASIQTCNKYFTDPAILDRDIQKEQSRRKLVSAVKLSFKKQRSLAQLSSSLLLPFSETIFYARFISGHSKRVVEITEFNKIMIRFFHKWW